MYLFLPFFFVCRFSKKNVSVTCIPSVSNYLDPNQAPDVHTVCKGFQQTTGNNLTLKAPIATKVVCFSRLLKCLEASMTNSVDPDQTVPIGAV